MVLGVSRICVVRVSAVQFTGLRGGSWITDTLWIFQQSRSVELGQQQWHYLAGTARPQPRHKSTGGMRREARREVHACAFLGDNDQRGCKPALHSSLGLAQPLVSTVQSLSCDQSLGLALLKLIDFFEKSVTETVHESLGLFAL